MCILTTRKSKSNSRAHSSKKGKPKPPSSQQEARYYYEKYPHLPTPHISPPYYYPPPPPPPPPTKHPRFYFSKPGKEATKATIQKQNLTMNNNLTPLVAVNAYQAYQLSPPAPPPLQLQIQRQRPRRNAHPTYQTTPLDWTQYYAEQARFQDMEIEIHRSRKREDIYQEIIVDPFLPRVHQHSQNQTQNQSNECGELKKEIATIRKEIDEQKREKELKEALEKGRKEGAEAEAVRKEKEKEKENEKEKEREMRGGDEKRWEMEREYGIFERSRGTAASSRNLEEARLGDVDGFARGRHFQSQALPPAGSGRRERVYGHPSPYHSPYEYDDFGYGGGHDGGANWGGRRGGGLGERLKGIETSQQRMEQRFQSEDRKREWQRERGQEDLMLRLSDGVGRLGRRFDC